MADSEKAVPDGNGGEREGLKDVWAKLDDNERFAYMQRVVSAQSGSDRKVSELNAELAGLRAKVGKAESEESTAVRELQSELAAFRSEKALVKRQVDALTAAAENRLPLDIALQLASLEGAPELIDKLAATVEAKARELTDARLMSTPVMGSGEKQHPLTYEEITRMAPDRIKKLPARVVDRAIAAASRGR